jgi:acyl-coenzyme A synthetase/AMP-(fatty) acid ligase
MFTSGSTGKPKGAAVSHRAATAALDMFQAEIQPGSDERAAGQVALGFDVSVFDIFVTLGNGGTLVLVTLDDGDDHQVFHRFCAALVQHRVTSLFTVPSVARAMLRAGGCVALRGLRRLLLTGEPLDRPLANRLLDCLPDPGSLWNLYGASEFPYVLARRVRRSDALPPSVFDRIGSGVQLGFRPLRAAADSDLDRRLPTGCSSHTATTAPSSPTGGQAGDPGPMELIVGGPAVFSGYLVNGTLVGAPGREGLGTADLAIRGTDGVIELLGRKDRTVKIAGFRADLDAIEARIEAHPEVMEAAVVPSSDNERLVAFVVSRAPATDDLAHRLDHHCRDLFAPWVCPNAYRFLDALPRTRSGKKDRPSLAEAPK